MDGYLGEVKMFAGNYPPQCWAYCQGQILAVQQYAALFSIIGNTYGGDGVNNFALPDLRGRISVGAGTGPGLTTRYPGQMAGYERVNLNTANLPPHKHSAFCDKTTPPAQLKNDPAGRVPATLSSGSGYGPTPSAEMNDDMIGNTGSGNSHENMQPWLCINYIICVEGNYPPRS